MPKAYFPEDPDAEKCLVSTVMASFVASQEPLVKALGCLQESSFVVPGARMAWGAMQRLYGAGKAVNHLSVKADLEAHGKLDAVGGFSGLVDLFVVDEFGDATSLVARIKELHERRVMDKIGWELRTGAQDLMKEPAELRSEVEQKLLSLEIQNRDSVARSGLDLLSRLTEGRPFRAVDGSEKLLVFPFQDWNDQVECAPGHVILLGARPKVGKTAFTVDTMVHTAMAGRKPFLISLEMDTDEIEARLAGRLTGYNSRMFLAHEYKNYQAHEALAKADMVARMSWWSHHSGVAWSRVEAEIRERKRTVGLDCVLIDYFTLIAKPTGQKGANDSTLWGQLSMAIKRLAQELRICILLVAQLNREGAEVEPHAHNFRETGQLEQDANAILMLWKSPSDGQVFGKVSENRSGEAVPKRSLKLDGGTNVFTMEPRNETAAPSGRSETAAWV